jgi:cell division protein FtsW (lipid II flippase)
MLRALSLLALPVAIGSAVMFAASAPGGLWAMHAATGLLAVAMYVLASGGPRLSERAIAMQVALAVGVLSLTLFTPGIQGVHRWLSLGSLRVHPSALLSPALLVLGAVYVESRTRVVAACAAAVQGVHLLQPDAGQATAWAAAGIALFGWGKLERQRSEGVVIVTSGALLAWLRPDPLAGVPFVEDTVRRAFGVATWLGGLAVVSLVGAVFAPRAMPTKAGANVDEMAVRRAEVALGVYLAAACVVTAFGEFPVPLLGFGMSATVGPFLGLSVLRRLKGY